MPPTISQIAFVPSSFSGTPPMSTTGRTKTRPTTIIPEMDEAGPIIRTVRDEARVPAAKQAAVNFTRL